MKRFSKLIVLSTLFVGALLSFDVNSADAGCRRARRCRPRRCCTDTCAPAPCPAPCAGPVCCG